MKEPLNVPKAKITSRNAERSHFICDYCDTDIVGIIHSCSVCPGIKERAHLYSRQIRH